MSGTKSYVVDNVDDWEAFGRLCVEWMDSADIEAMLGDLGDSGGSVGLVSLSALKESVSSRLEAERVERCEKPSGGLELAREVLGECDRGLLIRRLEDWLVSVVLEDWEAERLGDSGDGQAFEFVDTVWRFVVSLGLVISLSTEEEQEGGARA